MRIQNNLKNSKSSTSRRSRARNIARKRVVHARCCSSKRSSSSKRRSSSFVKYNDVSDKLEALKTLIPPHHHQHHQDVQNGSNYNYNNEIVKAEVLFQETADYIIVLKTQVFVLQKLIEFYDHGDGGDDHKSTNDQKHFAQQHQSSSLN